MRRIVFILAGTILLTAFQQQSEIIIARRRAQSGGGGGTITKVGTGTNPCYSATTCTLTGMSIGDLVFGFGGDNATLTVAAVLCSSSGTITAYDDTSSNANHIAGTWCIISGTSVTVSRATGTGGDTGITVIGLHSTTGWNTSTFVQAQATAPNNASGTSLTMPSITPTATKNAVACYILQESVGFTASGATESFTLGPAATSHSDATVYLLNAAASTYNPVVTVSSSGIGYGANCAGMGAN